MKSNDKQVTAKIDDIFDKIGEFGPYQLFILFLIGLTAMVPAILAYSYIFIGATPEFRYFI
jgi:F0F1-type ATP synthase assembly protein I